MTAQIVAFVLVGILLVVAINANKPKGEKSSFSWGGLATAIFLTISLAGGFGLCLLLILSMSNTPQ